MRGDILLVTFRYAFLQALQTFLPTHCTVILHSFPVDLTGKAVTFAREGVGQ